ncbi:outer membrane protein assembly factor BamE [Pelagerythrobacter sp.]|uniref:outer membrane protein assembly factor BamE n=1 Tax=Pelagerythrobacter sp. TaxID=2800702 RepID=UPI0035B1FA97
MKAGKALGVAAVLAVALAAGGCSSIRESRGYIRDATLVSAVQPGIDNQQSVAATLGRPSFTSQFGQPTWYYVSSITGRRPFVSPSIKEHSVLAVKFDTQGNVVSAEESGLEQVVFLDPDGKETPTLGRERGFFEDLFGNIGQVGAGGMGAPAGGPGV